MEFVRELWGAFVTGLLALLAFFGIILLCALAVLVMGLALGGVVMLFRGGLFVDCYIIALKALVISMLFFFVVTMFGFALD